MTPQRKASIQRLADDTQRILDSVTHPVASRGREPERFLLSLLRECLGGLDAAARRAEALEAVAEAARAWEPATGACEDFVTRGEACVGIRGPTRPRNEWCRVCALDEALSAITADPNAEDTSSEHVQLMRISGTLCDAGDIQVDPLPEGVASLLRSREEWKARAVLAEGEVIRFNDEHGAAVVERLTGELAEATALLVAHQWPPSTK